MAKRMVDTGAFSSPSMRGFKAPYKLLWLYMKHTCDHAAIWDVEMDVATLRCGYEYDVKKCLDAFGNAVVPVAGGSKWFVPDFITEFYGGVEKLNPKNRVHESVIDMLTNFGLKNFLNKEGADKGLISPSQATHTLPYPTNTLQIQGIEGVGERGTEGPTLEQVKEFFGQAGGNDESAEKFWNHHQGTGWKKGITPITNWRSFANNWIADDKNKTNGTNTSTKRTGNGGGSFTRGVSNVGGANVHD